MIAANPVDGATAWIDRQSAGHGLALDARVESLGRIEGKFGASILDQFHAHEQATAAYVADVGVIAEALSEPA